MRYIDNIFVLWWHNTKLIFECHIIHLYCQMLILYMSQSDRLSDRWRRCQPHDFMRVSSYVPWLLQMKDHDADVKFGFYKNYVNWYFTIYESWVLILISQEQVHITHDPILAHVKLYSLNVSIILFPRTNCYTTRISTVLYVLWHHVRTLKSVMLLKILFLAHNKINHQFQNTQ